MLVTGPNTPGQIIATYADGSDIAMEPSGQAADAIKAAESTLRNVLVAALTYEVDRASFLGFTPDEALPISGSLTYNTSPTAIPGR